MHYSTIYIPKTHISLYPTNQADQAQINSLKRGSRRRRHTTTITTEWVTNVRAS